MQSEVKPRAHAVALENRQRLRVSGVEDVDCFHEQAVVLVTSAGTLTVSGSGLQMAQLDLEQGKVEVSGQIDALEYAGQAAGTKRGLLSRIFR